MEKKIGLAGQTVLAIIPLFVTQLIAFYRIRKFKKGGLLVLGLFWAAVFVGYFFILPEWNQQIAWNIVQIVILGPPSVYYVRKWTKDYNKKHDSEIAGIG